MKFLAPYRRAARVLGLCGLLLALVILAGCGPRKPRPRRPNRKWTGPSANTRTAAQANPPSDQYASVFEDLQPPQGKDPFFPTSHRRDPVAPAATPGSGLGNSTLELKAIIRTSKHSQAVINNAILELGKKGPCMSRMAKFKFSASKLAPTM